MDVDLSQDGSSPQSDSNDLSNGSSDQTTRDSERQQSVENAIHELDKLEKFKFEGREYTPKALKDAILRQEDYSRKTGSLSEERKSFESERKYYDNLYADLNYVRNNPGAASEFIKLYPAKFHNALKQVLNESQGQSQQTQGQPQQQQTQQRQQFDVDTQSRIAQLESFINEQKVSKHEQAINQSIDKYAKTYPEANKEVVIARIFEAYNKGTPVTDALWEKEFKTQHEQEDAKFKAKYGEFVKKQTQANQKARGVPTGGGTPGTAPKKFKNLKEVTEHAASQYEGGS